VGRAWARLEMTPAPVIAPRMVLYTAQCALRVIRFALACRSSNYFRFVSQLAFDIVSQSRLRANQLQQKREKIMLTTLTETQANALIERNGRFYLEFTYPYKLTTFEFVKDESGMLATNLWAHTLAELIDLNII
jgi:hypothetical protein